MSYFETNFLEEADEFISKIDKVLVNEINRALGVKDKYYDMKIEYTDITPAAFVTKMNGFKTNLASLFAESKTLEIEIQKQLNGLKYE